MKALKIYSAFTTIVLLLVACGGGHTNVITGGSESPHLTVARAFGFSPIPNRGSMAFVNTAKPTAFNFDLVPTAHAQAPAAVSLVGNYNGYCTALPTSGTPADFALPMFGAGRLKDANCTDRWYSDASTAAANADAGSGALVIGAGTIQNLYVVSAGTGSADTSGKVQVWINRAGVIIPSTLTCTLGQAHECQDLTSTLPVNHLDRIIITITAKSGDTLQNVQWYLGKQ